MPHFVVGERRVKPGKMDAFIDVTRRIGDHLSRTSRPQSLFTVCVDQQDPDAALLIGAWSDPEDFTRASASIPPELVAETMQLANSTGERWRWYGLWREIMSFTSRPGFVRATYFCVDPAEVERWGRWALPLQDAAAKLPGVIATRILTRQGHPGALLHVGEYRDETLVEAIENLVLQDPRQIELKEIRNFQGPVQYIWERGEAR